MKSYSDWSKEQDLNECLGSAMKALKKHGISFKQVGKKIEVDPEDVSKAKAAIKADASAPSDVKFLA